MTPAADWLPPLLIAPVVGSLLGVLIRRLPEGRDVAWSRSACELCGHVLGPLDLVPIASFVARSGRCRHCGGRIAPFHLWVELAALTVALSAVLAGDAGLRLWLGCALGWTLLAAGWIDLQHFWLPDVLVLPLVPLGLGATLLLDPDAATANAAGAAAGYLAFQAIAWGYRRLRGREGLGQGDAKLLAVAGAWLGLGALPEVVLAAALAGLVLALIWRVRGGEVGAATALPFGPCLALAIWAVWLGGGADVYPP